jgi:hypothetical protein
MTTSILHQQQTLDRYFSMIRRKARRAVPKGLAKIPALNSAMFAYQADVTDYLLRIGCGAGFLDTGMGKALTQMAFGPTGFATLKNQVGKKAIEISQTSFNNPVFETDRARAVESIMVERMIALSSEEFQDLLRPCFQEDEIKLILVGAFLGFAAGICQLVFVFGGSVF